MPDILCDIYKIWRTCLQIHKIFEISDSLLEQVQRNIR